MALMVDDLLSADDMAELTDAKLKDRQIAVLKQNRIPFALSASGRPKTTWSALNTALSGGSKIGISVASMNTEGL